VRNLSNCGSLSAAFFVSGAAKTVKFFGFIHQHYVAVENMWRQAESIVLDATFG